jgi:small neutral amino acid transporter SnatA (MarC family)
VRVKHGVAFAAVSRNLPATMDVSLVSAVIILLLVMDPLGNIPFFISLLKHIESRRRTTIVLRECAIAYGVLVLFVLFGERMLKLLGLSDSSLNIAGGVILFLIALRMVFRHPEGLFGGTPEGEPFIVPLAIPSIAGPTAMASLLLALTVAMAVTLALLLFAERISRWIGERGLLALERLMGLLLTAVAVEMLLRGIEAFVRQLQTG